MAISRHDVWIVDFDSSMAWQAEKIGIPHHLIDCRDIDGIRYCCEKRALKKVNERLPGGRTGRVVLLGSGDFHHLTYLLLSTVAEPFTLILFDHHSDLMSSPAPDLCSCASWVADALELPALKQVVVIGPDKNNVPAAVKKRRQVFVVPYDDNMRHQAAMVPLFERLVRTRAVYISIDKDVLSYRDAVTNWDQGSISLKELLSLVTWLKRRYLVIGADICGEPRLLPLDLLKREGQEALAKNLYANRHLIGALMKNYEIHHPLAS